MLMARPRDWGDQFPSDINDQPPPSPTANFREGEAGNAPGTQKGKKLDPGLTFDPKVKPDLPQPQLGRDSFVGVILFETTTPFDSPRFYNVLLESGRVISAQVLNQTNYQQFRPSDPVVVIKGNAKDKWLLVGHQFWMDLPVTDVIRHIDSNWFDNNLRLPFTRVVFHIGEKPFDRRHAAGGPDPILILNDRILIDDPGIYEVTYHITLEPQNDETCTNFDRSIKVGAGKYDHSWLKLVSPDGGEWWLGANKNLVEADKYKMQFPAFDPYSISPYPGQHMFVEKSSPGCWEMAWTDPGVNGTISWYDSYGSYKYITFQRGVAIAGTGLVVSSPASFECHDDCPGGIPSTEGDISDFPL
jgi:hypothetical protein